MRPWKGGVGALLTSAGQAATMLAVLNIARAGDHIVSASAVYGGTFNLFHRTLREMGVDVTFVEPGVSDAELEAAFRPNTKLLFGKACPILPSTCWISSGLPGPPTRTECR